MKQHTLSKFYIIFILSITIIFTAFPLNASVTVSNLRHEAIIKQQISGIRVIQNHVFSLSQSIICYLPQDRSGIEKEINFINGRIETLGKEITAYLRTTPSISLENRDALLACVSLNFIKNALYQLSILSGQSSNVDRNILLEDFYLYKRFSVETLDALEDNF